MNYTGIVSLVFEFLIPLRTELYNNKVFMERLYFKKIIDYVHI